MYKKYTRTISDYSFFDSETFSFFISEKDNYKFEKSFNKNMKSGKTIEKSIELSGGDLSLNKAGYIEILRTDCVNLQVVNFVESKDGRYLIVEQFSDFSTNHMHHHYLTELFVEEKEMKHFAFELSEKLKELLNKQRDYQEKARALFRKNHEKEVEKQIKSLKGKNKKNEDEIRANLLSRYQKRDSDQVKAFMEEVRGLDEVITERMNVYFHKALIEKYCAKEIMPDETVESNDDSGLII